MAKYPFTPEAAKHVQQLDLKTTELDNPEYNEIIARAEQRIKEAIENALVSDPTTRAPGRSQLTKDEAELLSFPVAVMMVISTNDKLLKRRYSLAEAKRAYNLLKQEKEEKITEIAKKFGLDTKPAKTHDENLRITSSGFSLRFADYLKGAGIFHERKWKLVNRTIQHGEVQVTKDEIARLTAEQIRAYMEEKLGAKTDQKTDLTLPQGIADRIEKLKQLHMTLRKVQEEEMPKETVIEAFPPCIQKLYKTALDKGHLSHIERFTLTSFLLNAGMPIENVVECFRPASDFSEKMTRYQVEHIAGGRGTGEKYVPPKCETLRTHGICTGGDEVCERTWRPLQYYQKKTKLMKSNPPQK
jgi:DNA primase large subunit